MAKAGGWLLGGLLLGLGGCAEVSCFTAPDRAACYAAYAAYDDCKVRNDPLIRLVDERPVTHCTSEPIMRCSRGRDGNERCKTVDYRRRCTTRWEPVYDFREFNIAVRSCMAQAGQGAYTGRFTAWD